MRRKTSESPLKPRNGSSQQNLNHQHEHRRVDLTNQKRMPKLLSPKKPVPPSLNYTHGEVLPHLHRELSPARSIIQKTDPGFEREVTLPNQDSTKGNRVLTGAVNRTKLRALKGDNKSTGVLPEKNEPQNQKIKKNSSWSKNLSLKETKKNATPQNPAQKRSEIHQSPSPFDDVSEAIHEKDEVDEDDQTSPFSHSETEQSKEIHISPRELEQNYFSFHTQENAPSQLVPESPRGSQDQEGAGKWNKGRPAGINTGDMMNASGINLLTEGNTAKSPNQIRGAFMNEHISLGEFEKQKQKQKAMKEALDFQLNEKKRKQEEEKLKEKEFSQKEEERIKREMTLMKSRFDKETALESSKKMKTEINENSSSTQITSKLSPTKQLNRPETLTIENTRTEPRETPNSNLPVKSATSSVKKVFDFQMAEDFENQDSKSGNGIELLVDENKKLRDENSKKEELIDVLLNALKSKGRNSPKSQHSLALSNGSKADANSYKKAKAQLEKIEVESDFYGYYLNHFKGKVDPKEVSLSTHEDKTYSVNEYDNSEMKASRLKSKEKPNELSSLDTFKVSTPQVSFYRPQVGMNVRNTEPSNLTTNRVYSSPLTSHLNKYSIGSKAESKGLPYMPTATNFIPFSPNSMPLEAFKLPMSTTHGTKSNISIHKEFIHYNDNSIGRLKKRYEHSVDFAESKQQKIDYKQPLTTSRPMINILRDDGSFSSLKTNQFQKKESLLINPISSGTYGTYESKTMKASDPLQLSILDTAVSRVSNLTPKQNILYSQGFLNANQLRMTGKMNSLDTAYEKKLGDEHGKNVWGYAEANPNKRPSKEELLEKIKQLPKLENKSKFPKEIFSLSMKKRACP